MIDQLMTIADEITAELSGFLKNVLPGRVRGAMIGVDGFWLAAYKYKFIEIYPPHYYLSPSEILTSGITQDWHTFHPQPTDFKYRPTSWNDRCKVRDILKIHRQSTLK
jgi:hypothetical protein